MGFLMKKYHRRDEFFSLSRKEQVFEHPKVVAKRSGGNNQVLAFLAGPLIYPCMAEIRTMTDLKCLKGRLGSF